MHQALGSSIHYFYPFKQFNSFWFRFGIEVEMATLSLHQTRLKVIFIFQKWHRRASTLIYWTTEKTKIKKVY